MDDEFFRYIQERLDNEARKHRAMYSQNMLDGYLNICGFWVYAPEPDQKSVRFGTEEYMDKLWLQEIGIKS